MFINKESKLIMPYGAYELKATYQRNMLIAMGSVTVLVLCILLTVATISYFTDDIIKPPPPNPPIGIYIDISPPISIVQPKPDINFGNRRQIIADVGIPTPVADSIFTDDDFTLIPSIDELALLNGSGNGPFTGGKSTGLGVISDSIPEGDITPQTFIKVEMIPVLIYESTPNYPRFCEMAGITGIVGIWVLVDENGNVIKAEVVKSSGTEALDEAALEAAYKNKFKPGIQNKRAIKVGVTYTVEFTLDN